MLLVEVVVLLLLTGSVLPSPTEPPSPANCGKTFISPNKSFNVSTSKTFNGEFPWHAAVYRREKYGGRKFICSGVLLNRITIVTTAHCLYGDYGIVPPASLIISLGKHDIDVSALNTEEMHVTETIIYEKFDRFNLKHDIALIKMSSNTTYTSYVQPICLIDRLPEENLNSGIVVGWGHNKFSGKQSLLAKGEIVIQGADSCRYDHMDLFQNLLDATEMCGKYVAGTDLCPGDSGSGLFYEQNGRWFLRGIFSFGVTLSHRQRCDSAQLILFTTIFNYYDWIVDNM